MKNTDAIALLVADHHEVKEKFEEFFGLSHRAKAGKKKLADQICRDLTIHTQIEEEIFYPAARTVLDDDALVDEALVEHAAAKELIEQLDNMHVDDDLYDAKVTVLCEQIEHHVKEEETQLFPAIRKTDLDLVSLGEKMADRKRELEAGDDNN